MKTKKTVWIPAIIAAAVAAVLLAYYYYMSLSHGGGEVRPHVPSGGAEGFRPHRGEGPGGSGEIFKTLGTIAVFLGAASFTWFWFKKRRNSRSMLVRKAGKLFYAVHKLLGWTTLIAIAVHGIYFLITKSGDNKIYTGLAGFVILLAISGYGLFIPRIRNKWMRTVHRSLGLLWVPVLILHAGGSAIAAIVANLAVCVLVQFLEKRAERSEEPIPENR
ncbi:hypothetical protein E5161_11265 [Cohnella pontilimi]|uniref:Ferric oxidoreductase domain-containing protein n=1 Tax=Cohnella pontilimi TaxID=2564100 RepID=A0A4U0FAL3_9BACL|nr:hypothetical protein [Cohnella pontilimi]TJY41777.1 hypothetical protein E5161_11265 [Cohnella pontilimi]